MWCGRTPQCMHENASPHARPTRPTRAHYLGYIMRVIRYGPGYAGGILGGAIHPEMGRRNGALSTHLDFPMRLSHGPGLWIYFQYQYGDVRATLSWHVRAAARPRHARADDTTTHTPHTHHRTLRCTEPTTTGFLLKCGAPTSAIHLETKPDVIPSNLTFFRAP